MDSKTAARAVGRGCPLATLARPTRLPGRGRLPRRPGLLAPGRPIQHRLAEPDRVRRDLDGLVDAEELERLVQ